MRDSTTHSIQFLASVSKDRKALLDLLNFFSENEAIKQRQSSSREFESRKQNIQYTLKKKGIWRDLTINSSHSLVGEKKIIRSLPFSSGCKMSIRDSLNLPKTKTIYITLNE